MKFSKTYCVGLAILVTSQAMLLSAQAATKLSDRALRQTTETSHSNTNPVEILDCPKDMTKEACNRLQYERYAKQTGVSYDEFLRNEITNPLRNQVIKQPLLTQPLENPNAPVNPPANPGALFNQLQNLPNTVPQDLP